MTVKFGFYDSINSDRLYNAADINMMFEGVISDGVFELVGNGLRVEKDPGLMSVLVRDGRAWFNGTWLRNTSTLSLSLVPSSFINDRIDLIILEFDSGITVRQNSIKVLTGIPAAIPIPPTLANTSTLKQYALAEIRIPAGASSILDGNITTKIGTINTPYASLRELEPLDPDLEDIAYLTPSDNDILQRKSGRWVNRTLAQYITDLSSGLSALFAPITVKVDAADEATLRQRLDGLTYSQHFDVSSMPAGFTWAGSPFITPSTASFALPSQMFISNTGSWRAFLYGTLPTAVAYLQTVINYLAGTSNYGFVGLRYDDGSDNNYIELGLYNYGWSYHVAKIYKRIGGGAVTETTDAVNFYMPQMFVVSTAQYGTKWSSWGCNLNLGLTGQGATALIAYRIGVSGLSFTPTRFGIVFRGNTEFSSLTDAYYKD